MRRLLSIAALSGLALLGAADPSALPTFDLERLEKGVSRPVVVGDTLALEVRGLPADQGPYRVEAVEDAESITARGWQLLVIETGVEPGQLRVDFVPISPGSLTVPQVAILGTRGAVGRTNPFRIDVRSSIDPGDPAAQQAVDPRPPVGMGLPRSLVYLALGVALLAVAALGGFVRRWFIAYRKRLAEQALSVPVVPVSEDVLALRTLAELEKQGLVARGLHKKHAFAISDAIKRYSAARFGFDAMERTTREFCGELGRLGVSQSLVDRVQTLMEKLDLTKFTDRVPPAEEGSWALQEARSFVELTRRKTGSSPGAGGS